MTMKTLFPDSHMENQLNFTSTKNELNHTKSETVKLEPFCWMTNYLYYKHLAYVVERTFTNVCVIGNVI